MSDTPSLSGCWEKIGWAKEHIKQIRTKERSWAKSNPMRTVLTEDYPGIVVARGYFPAPPPRFSVLAGNVLHNVRSALDHLIWQLVLLNGQEPRSGAGGNSYPILDKPLERPFLVKPPSGLRGVKPDHRAFIESLQPYKPEGRDITRNLWRNLRELSDRDKHQLLNVVILRGRTDIRTQFTIRATPDIVVLGKYFPNIASELYDGTVLAVIQVDPSTFTAQSKVEVKCTLRAEVAVKHENWAAPLADHLSNMCAAAENIVEAFDPAFHGGPDPEWRDAAPITEVNYPI